MQRTTGGTPFKLRSGSPFKQTRMVRKTDDNRNELVDVTKGKTNVRKSWKQAWADNDEGIQGMYDSYEAYEADRKAAKAADAEAYEKDLVEKTGVSGGPGTVQTPDTVTPVASPGETIPEVKGDMKDTFTPQDIRMADRERKIIRNRSDKADKSIRNKQRRYDKNLGKAGYNFGMVKPTEMTTNEAGEEVPNVNYQSEMDAWNKNEQIKATFDKTRKGSRLSDKISSAQGDKDFYSEHAQRIQEGADQGVNPNKGRMIEEGKVMQAHQPESTTEGSDRTFVGDDHGYEVYEGQESLGGNNLEVANQSGNTGGGDTVPEGGMVNIENNEEGELTPEQQRLQSNIGRKAGSAALGMNPVGRAIKPIVKGIMGSGDHKQDFEGDRDPIYEPTWWDGAKSKFGNFFKSFGASDPMDRKLGINKEESSNKFGGPKMKFGRNKQY